MERKSHPSIFRKGGGRGKNSNPLGVDIVLPLLLALLIRNVAQGDGDEHQYGNPHYDADQYNLIVDALVRVT